MSDTSGGVGWWLASDGRWYPPHPVASPAWASSAVGTPGGLPPLVRPPAPIPELGVPGRPAYRLPYAGTAPASHPGAAPGGGAPDPYAYPYAVQPSSYPYPSPYAPAPPYPYGAGPDWRPPKTSSMAVWSLILVILLGAVGALVGIPLAFVARSRIRRSGGALKGSGLALAALIVGFGYVALVALAIAIPTFLGRATTGPPLQNLDYSVHNQITGSGPDDFAVPGIDAVACTPPVRWTTGATFTCIAYGTAGAEVGRYYGTVTPDASDGTYQWDGRYVPSI